MQFDVIKFINKTEWNDTIKSFKNWDVYYLNEYVNSFKLIGDGEPILIYFKDENIRIALVSMIRDIADIEIFNKSLPKGKFYDLSTPYGYGGPLIEGSISHESVERFIDSYTKFALENNIVSDFIRFNPITKNHLFFDKYYDISNIRNTVAINTKHGKDYVWENITSKNRNMIRKAIKNGVLISNDKEVATKEAFKAIYEDTMKRDGALDYYYFNDNFFESIFNGLKDNYTIFYATHDEKIIAASIILYSSTNCHYHFSGIKKEYMNLAANNLLLTEVAYWATDKNLNLFHLGGGYQGKDDSLFKFKKSFSKNGIYEFMIGKRIINKEKYDYLLDLRCDLDRDFDKNNEFFPAYRR